MPGFNKWIGLGNLTRDPEDRKAGQSNVTKFTLAVNRRKSQSAEQETLFIDCEAWGRSGEVIADFVRKGDPLLVEGQLRLDRWEKDGVKNSKILCVVERFELMKSKDS
jgi:single-strand DNA-binding protein